MTQKGNKFIYPLSSTETVQSKGNLLKNFIVRSLSTVKG